MLDAEFIPFPGDDLLRLAKTSKEFQQIIEQVLRSILLEFWNKTRDKAPVDTGNLRDSISQRFAKFSGGYELEIYTNVVYAAAMEYSEGFNFNKAHNPNAQFGYMRKSLAEMEPILKEAVETVMERLGGKDK